MYTRSLSFHLFLKPIISLRNPLINGSHKDYRNKIQKLIVSDVNGYCELVQNEHSNAYSIWTLMKIFVWLFMHFAHCCILYFYGRK